MCAFTSYHRTPIYCMWWHGRTTGAVFSTGTMYRGCIPLPLILFVCMQASILPVCYTNDRLSLLQDNVSILVGVQVQWLSNRYMYLVHLAFAGRSLCRCLYSNREGFTELFSCMLNVCIYHKSRNFHGQWGIYRPREHYNQIFSGARCTTSYSPLEYTKREVGRYECCWQYYTWGWADDTSNRFTHLAVLL